ncbi:reverse transcriptase domain-containing protein, partial [Tanacetum coccineum]
MTLKLANCSLCVPKGIARDVLVPVGRLTFPADFVVVDFECDYRVPLILGRPFLRTARTLIDVFGEEIVRSEELKYTTRPHKESVCMIDIFSSPKEKDEDPNAIFTSSEVVKCDSTIPTKEDLTNEKVEKHEIFISADGIKLFLLIMFLLVMFSFLLTEIESAGHVLVSADR